MFWFVLLTPTNMIDTTAKYCSFKSLYYGNVYGFGFVPFFNYWVIGAARISGIWQMNGFLMEAS